MVNKGDLFGSSANIKRANKEVKILVGKSTTVQNLLFCAHTLCMNYITNTFLFVSSPVRRKQLLCFVHGQGQKRGQKPTTRKVFGFHNHFRLLTMLLRVKAPKLSNRISGTSQNSFLYLHASTHSCKRNGLFYLLSLACLGRYSFQCRRQVSNNLN